jgi:hypothetical protein
MGAKSMWNHGSSNSRGVAILFSKTIDYEVIETGRDNTTFTVWIACSPNIDQIISFYMFFQFR